MKKSDRQKEYKKLENEVEALRSYKELKSDMQTRIEKEQHFRGYMDCILFLIRSGTLGTNVETS